jgi:glutathione S-transferase
VLMRYLGLEFEEVRIPLDQPDTRRRIHEFSPAGRVPILLHGRLTVWDSLAICEYIAELYPSAWPADRAARAHARSISAEMHSGFAALRKEMPMNVRATGRRVTPTAECRSDIERIKQVWRDCRSKYAEAGRWLFGGFSIADAMYAPVVTRFATYGVVCTGEEGRYTTHVLADPAMRDWKTGAESEAESIASSEVGL